MKTKPTKSETLKFRCTREDREQIRQIASQLHTSESSVLYDLVFDRPSSASDSSVISQRLLLHKLRNLLLSSKMPKKEKENIVKELDTYVSGNFETRTR